MSLALLLIFLSPMNMIGYTFQSLLLLLFLIRWMVKEKLEINFLQFSFAGLWLTSGMLGILTGIMGGFDFSSHSLLLFLYVFFSILIFPFKVQDESIISVLRAIVYLIFLSQIILAFQMGELSKILESIYSREGQSFKIFNQNEGLSQISWVRFGGIYINPNLCAKAYTLLLGLFIAINHKKRYSIHLIGLVSIVGLILTGSRTGLGIGVLILIIGYGVSTLRIFIYGFSLVGIVFLAVLLDLRFVDMETIKISMSLKLDIIIFYLEYISNEFPLALLFGTGDVSRIEYNSGLRLESVDSELGYLLQGMGLLAIPIIGMFILFGFKVIQTGGRVFMLNLFWMVSSTLLINIRFSLAYFFCLSIIYIKQSRLPILEEKKCLKSK
jgi:hypothetical protein